VYKVKKKRRWKMKCINATTPQDYFTVRVKRRFLAADFQPGFSAFYKQPQIVFSAKRDMRGRS